MNSTKNDGRLSPYHWQIVFDGVRELVCLLDPDFRVITINKATEDFLNKSASEVVGMRCWELFHGDCSPHLHCPACKLQPIHKRTELDFPEGDRWLKVTLDPFYNSSGVQAGILHIIRDITEQKQLENSLAVKAQELQKENTAKDNFLSVLAHDLRSPFHVLINLSNILFEDEQLMEEHERLKYSRMLNIEIKRVYGLLEDLLLWSNIKRGNSVLDIKQNDIKESILNCIYTLNRFANEKEIALIHPDTGTILAEYDENMLSSAIRNIVSNAIKFTPRGGSVQVSAAKEDQKLLISIADSGVGMSPEQVALFNSSGHLPTTSGTENEKGSGLGLKLSFEFVRQHNGTIKISSSPNSGTVFVITIPLQQKS